MNTRCQRIALVAATLLWSLSLTACGDGDSKKPQSAAVATNPPTATQSAAPSTPAPTTSAPADTPAPSTPTVADVIGSATLQWSAPLEKTDGSALQNLAGFKISYGTSASALNKSIRIDNPSIDQYVVEELPAGTYYFGVRAYDQTGAESELSNLMSKVIG